MTGEIIKAHIKYLSTDASNQRELLQCWRNHWVVQAAGSSALPKIFTDRITKPDEFNTQNSHQKLIQI